MSYDFSTRPTPCSHYQLIERYIINPSDLVSLLYAANPTQFMRAPINGKQSVIVYIGGTMISSSDPTYGYSIQKDTTQLLIGEDQRSKIIFNQPVRTVQLIEVSYITLQTYCYRCNGIGKCTDVIPSNLGSFIHLFGVDKLVQRSLKFMLTSRCPFYPQFTSQIKTYIGQKFGLSITQEDVAYQTTTALQNLINIQSAQQTVQSLDPSEILKDIVGVTAVQDDADPTLVHVSAEISNYGTLESSTLAFTIMSGTPTQNQ